METKTIIIAATNFQTLAGIIENGKYVEFYFDQLGYSSLVGNIYCGVIDDIVTSIEAAFVNFGDENRGFIHINEFADSFNIDENRRRRSSIKIFLKKNDRILVQIIKDAYNSKYPQLSAKLSISSRFIVILPERKHIGFSNKLLDDKIKTGFENLVEKFGLQDCGYIFRTEAAAATLDEIINDFEILNNQWRELKKRFEFCRQGELLYKSCDFINLLFKEIIKSGVKYEIYSDNKNIITQIESKILKSDKISLFYMPIEKENGIFNIYSEFDKCARNKVWLKCGGHLFIEHTEAFVSVDINTGKNTNEKNTNDIVFKTNFEALIELARQIRLRNLSGLIIVDLMNMLSEQKMTKLIEAFTEEMKKDKEKHDIIYTQETGILQIMRKRNKNSIKQAMFEKCPHCEGNGVVNKLESQILKIERKLRIHAIAGKNKKITVSVSNELFELMNKLNFKQKMEDDYKIKIILNKNENYDKLQYVIEDLS